MTETRGDETELRAGRRHGDVSNVQGQKGETELRAVDRDIADALGAETELRAVDRDIADALGAETELRNLAGWRTGVDALGRPVRVPIARDCSACPIEVGKEEARYLIDGSWFCSACRQQLWGRSNG